MSEYLTIDTILTVEQKKGCIIIFKIKTNYTSEMEKAMQQNHGIGYAEYNLSLKKRLQVEKNREQDYQISKKIV